MDRFHFPGFPSYLAAAAEELALPFADGPARRIAALAEVANLCAQASDAASEHVEAILAEAARFRDHLRLAHRAAELMIDEVRARSAVGPTGGQGRGEAAPPRPTRPERRPSQRL